MFFSLVVELSGKVVVGDDLFFGVCVLLVCLVRTSEGRGAKERGQQRGLKATVRDCQSLNF